MPAVIRNKALFFVLLGALLVQLVFAIIFLYQITITDIRQNLESKIENIKKDITYENGKWNLDKYNKNPELLGLYPLYIFTTDGYILDRRAPIHGFLDLSDFKRLLSFDKPRTFTSISGQKRRIYAKKLYVNGTPAGVIAVSYYNPSEEIIDKIDKQLIRNAESIYSKLIIKQGTIDVSSVNVKQIDYDVAFIIIDRFNTILLKRANVDNTDRIPNIIDPSYVKAQLNVSNETIVRDSQTGELFLTLRSTIGNKQEPPLGIVIIGQSLTALIKTIKQFLIWTGIANILIAFSAVLLLNSLLTSKKIQLSPSSQLPKKIVFSQKKGVLIIDGEDIVVPYATNQFYLLQALFSQPTKRWETDELLERFGEDTEETNSRKVYDAMLSINKKVAVIAKLKLILNQNKTYQLNPTILASKE